MLTALEQAAELLLSGDAQLMGIVAVTLRMSLTSSVLALIIGVPIGILYALGRFPGKAALVVINRTLMGLPPVVCGLICYMLFSGVGPLRHLRLLFTVRAMVIAQVMLITPLIIGNTESYVTGVAGDIRETATGLSLGLPRVFLLTVNEAKYQVISTYLLGFSRAIAEVGAVSMVGGAIAYKTNVMTTAIMNYTNMGDFTMGLSLGILLLLISLTVNVTLTLIQGRLAK